MTSQSTQEKTIRTQLLADMKSGIYAGCERLPRESVLAETLNISRTQLRDILASLEREGFITRRHGVGTIINRHVLDVQTRMDIEVEFLEMIRQSGFRPAVAYAHAEEGTADQYIADQLHIPVGSAVLRLTRLCTADGKPAIYCEDVLSKELIKAPYSSADLQRSIFHFLQEFCGVFAYMDLTDLRPTVADSTLADILQVSEGTPLLQMDEVDFDIDGKPIFCSKEFFVDGVFRHTVMRKKL